MQHLAYISMVAPDLLEADIDLILKQSRRNNPAQRISGHLQCHTGYFFQVLEGPGASLDSLLEKIRRDPRHRDLRILFREPLTQRNFANWSMGYGPCRHGSDLSKLAGKVRSLRDVPPGNAHRVLSLFLSLMDGE